MSIDIHHASDSHPASPYKAPFPKPQSGPLDAQGLKQRIAYGNMLRKDRNITSRTMRFINWWKEHCKNILDASPFRMKRMAEEIEILDDELQSRYEKLYGYDGIDNELQSRYEKTHGHDGLCTVLLELFNAMAELRLKAEYGDYLDYACTSLKGNNMNDIIWKVQKMDWQAVARCILEEESNMANEKRRHLAFSPTPYLDDIAKAAERLGCEGAMIRYQIIVYADRNSFCHSGIKEMVSQGYLQEFAERIIEDLRSLDTIFRDRPHEQIEMRRLVKLVEKEWFLRVWVEETRRDRRVLFALTDKGYQKMLSKAAAVP